ncbi:MerR family transcriptional regulator [Corallincola holothuriorum]|uniref:MerR family transcriptional regulator n=1 Tax=Corallincola holothuriorum TaxID=2282215 RepID=A0A368NMB1_9GAMM|nr:MerR family transcriptional regulator [Corallincola holothuriorum]
MERKKSSALMSIGQLSKMTNVKVPTIRYYEQQQLIIAACRSEGNQRQYSEQEFQRLTFIKHARDLGFSLDDVRQLISLDHQPHRSCESAHTIAAQHLNSVRSRLTRLRRLEHELERVVSLTDSGMNDQCSVIKALADHSQCEDEH